MSRSRACAQRGFTFVELVIVVAIASFGLSMAAGLLRGADDLSTDSRARLDGVLRYRAAHAAVAAALCNTALDSVEGLDLNGFATAPTFRRVEGMDGDVVQLAAREELAFRRTQAAHGNTPALGELVIRPAAGGTARVLARQVVEGRLRVRQEGRGLVVRLAVHVALHGSDVLAIEGETTTTLRN